MGKIEIKFTNRWLYSIALIIGIFGLAVGVYATSHPSPGHTTGEIDFSGTISTLNANQICLSGSCQTSWPSGGSGSSGGLKQFVGATTSTYDGAGVGGYAGGNSKCAAQFGSGARMCMSADFALGVPSGMAAGWYNTFTYSAGVLTTDINDCTGWTSSEAARSGPIWIDLTAIGGSINPTSFQCSIFAPILCCR